MVPPAELGGGPDTAPERQRLAAREPAEATADGLRALAAWQGLTLGMTVRWNGLAGGGPATPVGTRASLLAAPLHTLGIEEFFARLARHGRRAARRDADEGLVEWRNAAFVEYDRGTMGERDWEQKLVAYFDYRDSGRSRRDYADFPTLLVVVAAKQTREVAIEGQIAAIIRHLAVGRAPLPALLTTAPRLAADPAGPLGSVWREADTTNRRHWFRAGVSTLSLGHPGVLSGGGDGRTAVPRALARPPPGREPPDRGDRFRIRRQSGGPHDQSLPVHLDRHVARRGVRRPAGAPPHPGGPVG